jgi:apolipoprotein N-acyltransferase
MIKQLFLALASGASTTLAFAPFDLYLFAVISPAALFLLLNNQSLKRACWIGWSFGLGFFGTGVSWVYVSIHIYGHTPAIPAALLTLVFCAALGLLFLVQIALYQKFCRQRFAALCFGLLWLLFEWLRSWLFTGFPWLYLGYSTIDTPLAPLAALGGVWLLSMITICISMCVASLILSQKKSQLVLTFISVCIPLTASYLLPTEWTKASGEKINISIMQPNIRQEIKWDRQHLDSILSQYYKTTESILGKKVIIWPETAIPSMYSNVEAYFAPLVSSQQRLGGSLISGIPMKVEDKAHPKGRRLHNSILNLTENTHYHKQRLVPFGEYIPWQAEFRDLFNFLNIPDFNFSVPKVRKQPLMQVGDFKYSTAICYEIAYPELVREYSKTADLILTLSNDTWFSHSIGPDQHFQIARMRAVENGRWLVRSSNNGISAIVDHQGKVVKIAPRYEQAVLEGQVQPMQGLTPYQRIGQWPFIGVYLLLLGVGLYSNRKHAL